MEKLNVWAEQIKRNIEEQRSEIYKRDYGFYKLDRLERIAFHIDTFSDSCEHCRKLKPEIEELSKSISERINGTPKERASYEKQNENFISHLKSVHRLQADTWNSSLFTFVGFFGGFLLSIVIIFLFVPEFSFGNILQILGDTSGAYPESATVKFVFLVIFIPSIIAGRIYGSRKDRFNRKNNLIL